jgi:spermidine synthase
LKLLNSWRGRRRQAADAGVEISEEGGIRYLHLGSSTIQSGMRLDQPDELVLAYTRSMMAFLLFVGEPKTVVSIGLGGGSVNKWIYRRFAQTRQTVLELNPRVIAVARQHFHLPPDDERLQVVEGDGARWVADHPDSTDVILVDGYDGDAQVEELATQQFYAAAARALVRDGVLVVNLWGSSRSFDDYLHRIELAFEGRVTCVPALQKGNIIVLGFRRAPAHLRWDELRERARLLEARYGLEFVRFVEVLKRLNPHTEKRLLI